MSGYPQSTYDGAQTWFGRVNEDGSYSILARIGVLEGTGTMLSLDDEGALLRTHQLATSSPITCKVFALGTNKNNSAGVEITPAPTLSAANVFNSLRTLGWPTYEDPFGYNFRHDLGPLFAPAGNEWYLLEYKFTLRDGGVIWLPVKVKSSSLQTG